MTFLLLAASLAMNATIPTSSSPVVRIQLRSGSVAIRTSDRSQIRVASDAVINTRFFNADAVARALQTSYLPVFATTIQTQNGPVTLPAEQFEINLSRAPHEAVVLDGQDANLSLEVPASSALVLVNLAKGAVSLRDLKGGTFFLRVRNGAVRLDNVNGDGFAEILRGPLLASNSNFTHLRARTAVGNLFFTNCVSNQIQVSSVGGSILYDGGSFTPGLAHFETQGGDIALGLDRSDVRVNAHSTVERIFSTFPASRPTKSDAVVQAGSPRSDVTANSERGAIFLYSRSANWQAVSRLMQRRAVLMRLRPPMQFQRQAPAHHRLR